MKTLDQIIRHVSNCKFSDEDMEKVRKFCHQHYSGYIQKGTRKDLVPSTYEEFIKWFHNGFGSGDIVKYGNTYGIIGDSTSEGTYLMSYLDFNGNIINKRMDIISPFRLIKADKEEEEAFHKKFYGDGYDYKVKASEVTKICTPIKNHYYSYGEKIKGIDNVGIYHETRDGEYIFYGFLQDGKIIKDFKIPINYTPLREADHKNIARFKKAMMKARLMFDPKKEELTKILERRPGNRYYFLNEFLEIEADKDIGGKRHTMRYNAGNYFTDYEKALNFMWEVKKLRKEGF